MASINSDYEINVAKKRNPDDKYGVYFCKIEIPAVFASEAEESLQFFRKLFGDEYHVSMTHWKCHGEQKKGWE